MRIIRDLAIGQAPAPFDIIYNGDLAVDSVTKRHKGSLCKITDADDADHGVFVTFAGLTTAMENLCGILEEDQPTTGNYLPDDAIYGPARRKMSPIMPTSVIRAEYVQKDADGTDNTDTGATCTAGATAFTITVVAIDSMIGGWIYMVTGDNAGFLSYITDSTATAVTLADAPTYAIASDDTFLVIETPLADALDFNATYTDIKSEIASSSKNNDVQGIEHYISAPGIPLQRLDRNKHSGLIIANAKFYHDFTIPSPAAGGNVWIMGKALT